MLSYDAPSPLMQTARKQEYRLYLDVLPQQATAAAIKAESEDWAGIILTLRQSERAQALSAFASSIGSSQVLCA